MDSTIWGLKELVVNANKTMASDLAAVKSFMSKISMFHTAVKVAPRHFMALVKAGSKPPSIEPTEAVSQLTAIAGAGEKFWSFPDLIQRVQQLQLESL